MAVLPTIGGSANNWGSQLNTWLQVAHNPDGSLSDVNGTTSVVNVQDPQFGAVGDGVADDTAAIQAAIDFITGSANPATNARAAKFPLFIPPGFYKVTSDLIIRSTINFRFIGAGSGQTILYASGTGFSQAVLLIDGSSDGVFEGFDIRGLGTEKAGASNLPAGIRLDFTSAASRSTTGNRFRDIRVRALKFVTGISLEGNGSAQVDGTLLDNVVVSGAQTPGSWSSSGLYQVGFAFGNGTYANNYDHVGVAIGAANCYYGYKINASSIGLYGSQPAGNFCDFWIVPNGQNTINNIQSQDSGQFLINPTGFSTLPVEVSCVGFITVYPQSGNPLITLAGGIWSIRALSATMISGASYVSPVIKTNGAGPNRPCNLSLANVALKGAKTTCISPTASESNISVVNYSNYDPATGNYTTAAGDLMSYYSGTAWTNL